MDRMDLDLDIYVVFLGAVVHLAVVTVAIVTAS